MAGPKRAELAAPEGSLKPFVRRPAIRAGHPMAMGTFIFFVSKRVHIPGAVCLLYIPLSAPLLDIVAGHNSFLAASLIKETLSKLTDNPKPISKH